jgi:membrane-associated protease RseP (regulator of RpoE activity)
MAHPKDAPSDLWHLVLVDAEMPQRQRSGLAWDQDGTGPDAFLRLVIEGRKVWESESVEDQTHPRWNASPPNNLAFDRTVKVRIELWDSDGVTSDPIGIYEGRALADAIIGADTIIKLEGGATLTLRLEPPLPHVGTGVGLYELRRDALFVLDVLPNSPASRAGMRVGDRITAIDGRTIDELGAKRAESALSMAAQQGSELTLERAGKFERVSLDKGYVWLSM